MNDELAREVLLEQWFCNVAQLLDGWHCDVAWSEWDESIRAAIQRIQETVRTYKADSDALAEGRRLYELQMHHTDRIDCPGCDAAGDLFDWCARTLGAAPAPDKSSDVAPDVRQEEE